MFSKTTVFECAKACSASWDLRLQLLLPAGIALHYNINFSGNYSCSKSPELFTSSTFIAHSHSGTHYWQYACACVVIPVRLEGWRKHTHKRWSFHQACVCICDDIFRHTHLEYLQDLKWQRLQSADKRKRLVWKLHFGDFYHILALHHINLRYDHVWLMWDSFPKLQCVL